MRRLEAKTRNDRIRNKTIRLSLTMNSAVEGIQKTNLKWYGHLIWMNNENKTKQVFEA